MEVRRDGKIEALGEVRVAKTANEDPKSYGLEHFGSGSSFGWCVQGECKDEERGLCLRSLSALIAQFRKMLNCITICNVNVVPETFLGYPSNFRSAEQHDA